MSERPRSAAAELSELRSWESLFAPAACCSLWLGSPLNKAYPAEGTPYLTAYLRVAMSQTFNSPGSLSIDPPAEANILPSGLNATDHTA